MWTIRLILLGAFALLDRISVYLLRYRDRYRSLLASTAFNTALVAVSHILCYLVVGLPPAGGWGSRPVWLRYTSVHIGFPVVGLLLISAGASLAIATFRQRRVIGVQDVEEGLLTSGCYRFFRHPISTGILWVSLGIPLTMRNPDGLLMFPAIFVVMFAGTILEEKNDMAARFPEQYAAYRHRTRMFGPIWLWGIIVAILLLLVGVGWNVHAPEL